MNKITISTGHPDAGRVYAEAYEEALAREASLREELARYKSLFGQAQKAIDRLNELHPKRMGELAKRLSVAEQLLMDTSSALDMVADNTDDYDAAEICRERVRLIGAALKTAAEGEGS